MHGYALNLDCWHFQREAFRGKHRMAFYDQRSHGRSERSDREHATIDQLGDDLARVIEEVAPKGDVVLVGHSMGGMSIIALAERHPELFAKRVTGVALVSTTAGGLRPHRTLGRWVPDRLGTMVAPRVIAALAKAPELVDSARRSGSNIGFIVADMFAFGSKDVPAAEVEFLDEMLAGTSFDVLAEFFPNFSQLDKFDHLGALGKMPTTIICGTKDKLTSIGHSRKMAAAPPGRRAGRVRGRRAHGHLRGAGPGERGAGGPRGRCLDMSDDITVETVDGSPSRGRPGRGARGVRQPAPSRPARDCARGDPRVGRARRSTRTVACSSSTTARRPGALMFEPRGRLLGLRRVGVLAPVRGLGVAAQMASRAREIAQELGFSGLELEARVELPGTINFWRNLGYVESERNGNRLTMLRMLPITHRLETAEDTRAFGEHLGDPAGGR